METKEKASFGSTVLSTFIGLISFFAITLVIGVILSVSLKILGSVPIIGPILLLFVNVRFLEIDDFAIGFALLFSVYFTCLIISRIADSRPTENLSCKILGAFVSLMYGISIVLNFMNGAPLLGMVMYTAAGIVIFFHDRIGLEKK